MSISYLDVTGGTTPKTSSDKTKEDEDNTSFTQTDFITLLVEELTNQDPTSPTTTSEMMDQLTQMQNITASQEQTDALSTMTESMETMTEGFETMSELMDTMSTMLYQMAYDNTFQNACAQTGSYVYGTNAEGKAVEGVAANAFIKDSTIMLTLEDGTTLPYAKVTKVISNYEEDSTTTGATTTTGAAATT